jgi:hypothetical protein
MTRLSLNQKIELVLNNAKMTNKEKIGVIALLIEGYITEKYEPTNIEKVHQQVMSETLYLLSRTKKGETNQAFIRERINLTRRNCSKWTTSKYQEENLEGYQVYQVHPRKEEKKRKRNTGWHSKTWERFNRFCLGINVGTKKKRQPARPKLPLNLTPNKEVE